MTTNQIEQAGGPTGLPLRRPWQPRILGGVASGIAEYFGLDVAVVRVAFVVMAVLGGVGIPVYLAGWLLIPEEGTTESIAEQWLHEHRQRTDRTPSQEEMTHR
jgi:phage shock protein C